MKKEQDSRQIRSATVLREQLKLQNNIKCDSQSPAQLQNIEYCDAFFNNTLLILEYKILSITGNKLALYGLPEPVHDQPELTSKDVLRETSYAVQALRAYTVTNVPRLTPDKQQAFIAIIGMIGSERGGIVFLDAPGDTDKTFLLNLLMAFVRKEKDMAVAAASSGIAATLLAGCRTAHSAFKLPLDLARSDSTTCNISKGTEQGHVLKTCQLVVWDEATMRHRNAFHALDKTLQDLRGSSSIMGGATVVLIGDFRQTLPIVTRGTPADQINACLKNSYLWHHGEKFSLTTNRRSHIQGDLFAGQFTNKLIQIGDGKVPDDPSTGLIIMPCGQIFNSPDEPRCKILMCILTFSKTSRIRTGFLTEKFWQAEMMWLRSSMSPFRGSFQGKNVSTSP
ncbi:ATP-dependent DNA helicase [Trichonephila clavipes]|nr:ATP-dependent DNA helicase [Trichonephila clavipes]